MSDDRITRQVMRDMKRRAEAAVATATRRKKSTAAALQRAWDADNAAGKEALSISKAQFRA